MICNFQVSVEVVGSDFKPESLPIIPSWRVATENRPGDIGSVGRYRSKPIPYGSATLVPQMDKLGDFDEPRLQELLAELKQGIGAIQRAGAEDTYLDIAITYRDQCNFEIGPQILKSLGELNLPVSISCYVD